MGRIKWNEVLTQVDRALTRFGAEGVKPTLRTLFYWLVSKGVIPNVSSSYKALSRKLVKARKEGRYEWDFLEDKTRVTLGGLKDDRYEDDRLDRFEDTIESRLEELSLDRMLDETFDYLEPVFYVERWAEQPEVVEIWIEKEALASTIESWVSDLGVPIRVNRGYSSWTFIYDNVRALTRALQKHKKITILYLGDLDPSGVDIQRFLEEALRYFGLDPDAVRFERLAVTPEQVERFNLPPRPEDAETLAKLSRDSRTKNYSLDYIVELDALVAFVPKEFREMVRRAVEERWDKSVYAKWTRRAGELRAEARALLERVKARARRKILEELTGAED